MTAVSAGGCAPLPRSAWGGRYGARLSRRALLGGSSAVALVAVVGGCRDEPEIAQNGQPWADGTFFDDGTGWAE